MAQITQSFIDRLNKLDFSRMYEGDFFLTWEKTDDELKAVFTIADALRAMRENNISTKIFDSGLGISLFRDNSTRTRFSFASACNLLGLEVQDLVVCAALYAAVPMLYKPGDKSESATSFRQELTGNDIR